ncbi:class I SAM-dependent methyltransferase [Mycolicibacterium neoaurum]|uniref:class I SAM-dependent methyltransferase n=1 Tax=Mycolicibacterium neoaurum TaxID=1795 RepID=UPI002673D446|nr:class I SAM-dependent methyltransferase [Mycolicibacterium neoaurum]MDO3399905.1 class I SAM-dependent methyltransferase [Mycolicibacterium neoaurum]
MSTAIPSPLLDDLIASWEDQQTAYIRHRAQRFEVILDAVSYARPDVRTVLDIGAGLGSFSKRILARFPEARVHALDYDPALLQLARHNLAEHADRVTLIEADLRNPDWAGTVGVKPDVVVSSTALHWLPAGKLVALYQMLAGLLEPGALFFNADHLSHSLGTFFHKVGTIDDEHSQAEAFSAGVPDWNDWWSRLRGTEGFADLVAERDRRFADDAPENLDTTAVLHTEALRVAGFAETGTVWQYFDDYVVYGVR